MPLSEGEQRRLDEIELALRTDDPKFVATITIEHLRRQHVVVASTIFVLGMIALVSGLVVTDATLWVGVIISLVGVGAMVTGVFVHFRPGRLG